MMFKEFLKSTKSFSGEVISNDLEESRFSFEWDNTTDFTEEGEKVFFTILHAEVEFDTTNNRRINVIVLKNEELTQETYDLFMSAVAGYIPQKNYDKWFKERELGFKQQLIERMATMKLGEKIGFEAKIKGTLNVYPFDKEVEEIRTFKIERVI